VHMQREGSSDLRVLVQEFGIPWWHMQGWPVYMRISTAAPAAVWELRKD